jgi:hypothetical protein
MKNLINLLFLLSTFLISISGYTQSVIDEIEGDTEILSSLDIESLPVERIRKISASRRVFILTNKNNSYYKGDFITLVLNHKLACRAIVAKTSNGDAGIKIVKIYSLDLWNQLKEQIEVKVIRGDDSFFRYKKKKQAEENSDELKINDEDDLFNDDVTITDDGEIQENSKRHIKTDNIISFSILLLDGLDANSQQKKYTHFAGTWAYQLSDNIWGEFVYSQLTVSDFPATSQDTQVSNMTIRAKYTFKAPLDSFLQPYIGFQLINANSPLAGDTSTGKSETVLNSERKLVEDTKKNGLIFGITLLRRLAPGWFVKADLGSDVIGGGFALEF